MVFYSSLYSLLISHSVSFRGEGFLFDFISFLTLMYSNLSLAVTDLSHIYFSSVFAFLHYVLHFGRRVQHAIGYIEGDKYYGARATLNVWNPKIQQPNEFSLSQLWILGGSFGQDLNSIEAGWQVPNHPFNFFSKLIFFSIPYQSLNVSLYPPTGQP